MRFEEITLGPSGRASPLGPRPGYHFDPDKVVHGEEYFDPPPASASNIFGWTWLGNWAENSSEAPEAARTFIAKWVKRFNDEVVLGGDGSQQFEDVFIQNFLLDLSKQPWWAGRTAAWQAMQKLRYGVGVPQGEYQALVDSTTDYVVDYARGLGFDIDSESVISGEDSVRDLVGELLDNASVVGANGLPTLDQTLVDKLIEKKFLPARKFDEDEGSLDVGPGALRDLYNRFKNIASNNYVSIADEELWDLVTQVKREERNWQSAYDTISQKVGDQYSFLNGTAILDRINQFTYDEGTRSFGGSSLRNHLDPIRTRLADVWEMNTNEVRLQDVFGSQLDSLIVGEGDDQRFMNSREAARWARTQPQFQQTSAYSQGMSNIMSSMLQMFGVR